MAGCDCKDGQRGPMGLQGPQGETGAQGASGGQGAQGTEGLRGLSGTVGARGLKGFHGSDGIAGTQGPAGIPGTDGIDGAVGSRGPSGIDGTDGAQGGPGPQGVQGVQGNQGIQGLAGKGRYVIGSYISLTGTGNLSPIGEDILFSQSVTGFTLQNDGDEIELLLDTEYIDNDLVYLIFELDPLNRYVYSYQMTDIDIRSISIVITRVDATTQFWSIQDICKNVATSAITIKTFETSLTNFDASKPMVFKILADNTVIGANQVVLKKCSMYLNRRQ
tara:strand:- start:1067 stop:1894 length:828 start_codon:yes stop_codon:yes gene_type:complete